MRIYYVHPVMVGAVSRWPAVLAACREMEFDCIGTAPLFAPGAFGDIFLTGDHDAVHPALQKAQPADEVLGELCEMCAGFGLKLIIDIVLDRVAVDGQLASTRPGWFHTAPPGQAIRIDPRMRRLELGAACARFDDPAAAEELAEWWRGRLTRLVSVGVAGFRCERPQLVPRSVWRHIIAGARQASTACRFLAWTPGLQWSQISALRGAGFDAVFSSLPWWDGRSGWFIEEHELLRQLGPVLAAPEAPFGTRLARQPGSPGDIALAYKHALRRAAAIGDGLLIPMGFECACPHAMDRRQAERMDLATAEEDRTVDLSKDIRAANVLTHRIAKLGVRGEMRALTGPGSATTAVLRANHNDVRYARTAMAILINSDLSCAHTPPILLDPLPPSAGASFGRPTPIEEGDPASALAPGEIRLIRVGRSVAVRQRRNDHGLRKLASTCPRIVIDKISPAVDGGRFACKRVIGEQITVEADVFADGHDVLAVELIWRAIDENEWQRVRMQPLGNDRWQSVIAPSRIGRHLYTLEAWRDEYATFCRDLEIKRSAGADLKLEVEEGCRMLAEAGKRANGQAQKIIEAALASLTKPCHGKGVEWFLAPDLREAMACCDERPFSHQQQPALPIEIERPQAGFGSWYELFPRSATDDPARHGTLEGVIARLPAIRDMGFDVLYLPPIHPIGTTNRKGRNNSLAAGPDDVGSAYAIGGEEGGHDAIHPALGTIKDFRRLRDAAAAHGLEIALDFAVQCSPDHPWLSEHPGWFRWRPDGSLRFAENPPKKYEDIVNVDFYADQAIPDLWTTLRDVVLYWVNEGVLIFRVDNPHTKPLPFWEWVIADVRARHPEVIFLSEAFTRPKLMYRLAKIGFSQSYTYFTWRNSKQELIDYLVELTTSEVKEYFRPQFFVNTPDINPFFLQTSGRPGFLIRAALAATLSGLWGMYSGFELCESAPLPGREEYLDSEKYQIRVRDYDAPSNIAAEIAKLNRIRKGSPGLQSHLGLRFYNAFNDQVIYYGKPLPARDNMILIAVSLDPHNPQEATIEVPLWEWGLPDGASVMVEDLMRGTSFIWSGKLQRIRLDPDELPFSIWRIAPPRGGK